MKKLIFILCISFQTLALFAQSNSQNTLTITDANFDKNVIVKITSQTIAILSNGTESITVPISIKDGKVFLNNKSESKTVLEKLHIPESVVAQKYTQHTDLENLEKLLTRANELDQRTLYISSPNSTEAGEDEILVNPNTATGESITESSGFAWYWLPIVGILGAAVGFVASSMNKKNLPIPQEIEVEEDAQQLAVVSTEDIPIQQEDGKKSRSNVNITQLKSKYDKLRDDSKILKQSYTDLKRNHKEIKQALDADMAYYKKAYQDIVTPLQQALDQGNLSMIYKYLTIAAIQYNAITRAKLTKKQNYDITNINTLLNTKTDHQSYPEITQNTPVDQTPAQLRNVISVLKQLGVKDLDNYILQGYKLNDL